MIGPQPNSRNSDSDSRTLLEMRGMRKSFFGVEVLSGIDLRLGPGECLAVCGENGAGKSTLIKLLGGAIPADAGEILIDGRTVHIDSPLTAQYLGISIIYQEFNLVPDLTVRENIFLGREQARLGFPNRREESTVALELLRRLGLQIDPEERCGDLAIAEQQAVEVAKALSFRARIVVMDEPSATLTRKETLRLFQIVRDLKASNIGVIYITHRIEEIFEVAERVLVLRDGQHIATEWTRDVKREKLIELIVGRTLDTEFPARSVEKGKELLRAEALYGARVRNVSFNVRAGEVLGFAGLVGAGRTEVMRLVFGADLLLGGSLYVEGRLVKIRNPRDAIERGICLLTEDRQGEGLFLDHTVRENFALPNLDLFRSKIFIDSRKERRALRDHVGSLHIRMTSTEQPVRTLSGGNQQKVVLAKWLQRDCRIVIFDEPTRGIDVAAKYEIYLLINRLAAQGKAIIMVSSDLQEILGMSDRIVVMHEGRVRAELADVVNVTQEQIMSMIIR